MLECRPGLAGHWSAQRPGIPGRRGAWSESEIAESPVNRDKAKHWKLTAKGVTFIEHGKPWAEIETL